MLQLLAQNSDQVRVTEETLNNLNPLQQSNVSTFRDGVTIGAVLSRFLDFAFPIAGIILLLMILWGGFEMVYGATNKKSLDAGRQRITSAIVGFIILFVTLWVIQIVETLFGITIISIV